jgi:hypothetical protein
MSRPIILLSLSLALLSGCIEVPDLEAKVSDEAENAEAPNLLPIGIATATSVEPRLDGSEAEVLSRRAEDLRLETQKTQSDASFEELDEKARKLNQRAEDLRSR